VHYEPRVNGSIGRINRDIRFSQDKSPYKAHLDLWFWHGDRRGWSLPGFFFRLTDKTLILGVGMHMLDKEQLAAFRDAIVDAKQGTALMAAIDKVKKAGPYAVGGAARKTVPRGFDKEHPRAELLLYEGLHSAWEGPWPAEAATAKCPDWCAAHFRAQWPVGKWLLGVLES